MQFHQVESQPHTYIVENEGMQLGTVDEFHRNEKVSYIGTRFAGPIVGMPMPFEQKTFPGFTAALEFVGKGK